MFRARALRWVLLLAVLSSTMLVACGDPRTPEGAGYDIEVTFSPLKGASLPPIDAKDVRVYSTKELPVGVRWDSIGLRVADGYPSAARPHRILGYLRARERVMVEVADAWTLPGFVAQREASLKRAAAEHGANAVFVESTQIPDTGRRNSEYAAVYLSDAAPEYPSVEEILARLDLEGFKEIHRFEAKLSELPARRPEGLRLNAGFEYRFAIALHPGAVELGLPENMELGFLVEVGNDPLGDAAREGRFNAPIDTSRADVDAAPPIDGVFARGGVGTMGGIGRKVGVEFATRAATVRFMAYDPMKGRMELPRLGAGEADFVVYERKVPADVLRERACFYCQSVAEECSKRAPLASCAELQACFSKIEQPLSGCASAYKGI